MFAATANRKRVTLCAEKYSALKARIDDQALAAGHFIANFAAQHAPAILTKKFIAVVATMHHAAIIAGGLKAVPAAQRFATFFAGVCFAPVAVVDGIIAP